MSPLIILPFLLGANALQVQFTIQNKASAEIWIGIQGNSGKTNLQSGGFILGPGEQKTISADQDWSGRFWGRTGCNSQTKHCETGDCGNRMQCGGNGGAPPATVIEINLRGSGNQDYYDISLVDGFNLKASITPSGGTGTCKTIKCSSNLNLNCPKELRLIAPSGGIIGCKSSCEAFNTDQCCCRGIYGSPDTCNPEKNCLPVNSAKYFKDNCPDAYSYAYDDRSSTFTCLASAYFITFG